MDNFDLRKYFLKSKLNEDVTFARNERLIQFIEDVNSLRSKYLGDIIDNKEILDIMDTLNNYIQNEIK